MVSSAANIAALGSELRLAIEPTWQNGPVAIGTKLSSGLGIFTLTRLDGLLSELALQRANGEWVQSKDWFVHLSLEQGQLHAKADGVPDDEFQAIRFRVGLKSKIDRADPQRWPPNHPLHPEVCGLHWGWSSGYVFLAIEGHLHRPPAKIDGFSYHLAGAAEPMLIHLPVRFSGKQDSTIHLRLDLAKVLGDGEFFARSTSTHSRENDDLAVELKKRVRQAFSVTEIAADLFQQPRQPVATLDRKGAGTVIGTKYFPSISERLPQVKFPEDNPLTVEGIELGRKLFHERRLSRGNVQSCADCHDREKGFADGQRVSVGASGLAGRRNAMSLVNLAWAREMFWDGRAKSLREQVLMPIQDTHEMNETLEAVVSKLAAINGYREAFKDAFGTDVISSERVALALEQFLLTLISQDSKFDRAARKLERLTKQEQRGLELFVTEHDPARNLRGADCFHCHGGNLFTNHKFMNNGLEPLGRDLGRMEATQLESDRGKFKVPSLRNVAVTAPYMHDGRFTTLEQVVEHYNGRLHRSPTLDPNLAKHPEAGLGLSESDKAALVAFLKTLTDEKFLKSGPQEKKQLTQIEQESYAPLNPLPR